MDLDPPGCTLHWKLMQMPIHSLSRKVFNWKRLPSGLVKWKCCQSRKLSTRNVVKQKCSQGEMLSSWSRHMGRLGKDEDQAPFSLPVPQATVSFRLHLFLLLVPSAFLFFCFLPSFHVPSFRKTARSVCGVLSLGHVQTAFSINGPKFSSSFRAWFMLDAGMAEQTQEAF